MKKKEILNQTPHRLITSNSRTRSHRWIEIRDRLIIPKLFEIFCDVASGRDGLPFLATSHSRILDSEYRSGDVKMRLVEHRVGFQRLLRRIQSAFQIRQVSDA